MKNHIPNNIEIQHFENKSKIKKMQEAFRQKALTLKRIDFKINNRNHAVLLTDAQLVKAERKALKADLTLHQYYINKYSRY